MKLDTKAIRYLSSDEWRTLTAVEMGSKNHEIVPTPLIQQIAGLRGSTGVHKCISGLAKVGLIGKIKNAKYDGYRLTYGGLDYLALNAHRKSSNIYSVGNQIGVGKESDIYVVASSSGEKRVLKIHRLGRISFRTVKANRDYLRNRSSGSWMYMSRLAALKEYAFMQVLRENGFPVPNPLAQNRHTIVMSLIDAFPLRQISSVPDPASLYADLMALIVKLASFGLIHGDFNEFNILLEEIPDGTESPPTITLNPIIIDFPQMVSIDHQNAQFYFDRDVACIRRYFSRRFHFTSDEPGPFFSEAIKIVGKRLDVEVEASGFSRKMAKELDRYMKEVGVDGDGEGGGEGSGDRDEDADEVSGEEEAEHEDSNGEDIPIASEPGEVASDHEAPQLVSSQEGVKPSLASGLNEAMTVLDIQDADLEDLKDDSQESTAKPSRTAKQASGWSI